MTRRRMTARFEAPRDALRALEVLRDGLGIDSRNIRSTVDCVLHIDVAGFDHHAVAAMLRANNACHVIYIECETEGGWFSHHYGRVTGSAVAPGEGDAEAGMSQRGGS